MELDRGKKWLPYHLQFNVDCKHTMFCDFIQSLRGILPISTSPPELFGILSVEPMLRNIKNALLRRVQNKMVTKPVMWLFLN